MEVAWNAEREQALRDALVAICRAGPDSDWDVRLPAAHAITLIAEVDEGKAVMASDDVLAVMAEFGRGDVVAAAYLERLMADERGAAEENSI